MKEKTTINDGEPPYPISNDKGVYWLNPEQFNRACKCVNACAGMADPAAEIPVMWDMKMGLCGLSTQETYSKAQEAKALRSYIDELKSFLPDDDTIYSGINRLKSENEALRENLAREKQALQNAAKDCFRFVQENNKAREENKAMRDAIKEAKVVLADAAKDTYIIAGDDDGGFGCQDDTQPTGLAIRAQATLTKLKPFLP